MTHDHKTDRHLATILPIYTQAMRVQQYSPSTIETQTLLAKWFFAFCAERGVLTVDGISRQLIDRYQHYLFALRVKTGPSHLTTNPEKQHYRSLSVGGQRGRLWAVARFCRWAVRVGYFENSPASALDLPRKQQPLPTAAFSIAEVEKIMALPNVETGSGLRDRALMELLYATGMRRAEACALTTADIERERGVVRIVAGKGNKGRIVPMSKRALSWLDHYLDHVWSRFARALTHQRVFISVDDAKKRHQGFPLSVHAITRMVGIYVVASGVRKSGACHLFRHTAATLMMEHGADIRAIQDFLGHASVETTGLYTNVSVQFLKEQHTKTHPSSFTAGGADASLPRSSR